jgi:N-acetylmuramoyl-L-alanine amidase
MKKILIPFLFFIFANIFAQSSKFTVVLDAGHGGKDPGTVGNNRYKTYEKHIALAVTLEIGKLLEKHNDIKTIYTRKKNVFIPLHKRGDIANKADADLFVSIHCNSAVTNAYGTTTYVLGMGKTAKNFELSKRENDVILLEDDYEKHYDYDPNSQEFIIGLRLMQEDYQDKSIEFAQIVQNKFKTVAKRKDRGVNQGNLAVLYDSYMPSVLIEIGFLTNKKEEDFLHSKKGQKLIAKAIYEAIKTYKKRLESNSVASIDKTNSTEIETNVKNVMSNSYYTIQIATSRNEIETKPYNFKNLKNVVRKKVGNIYKYYYGKTTNLNEARKIRKEIIPLFRDAFIRKFTEKVTVQETIETVDKPKRNKNERTFEGIDFKIQLSSSPKKIETKPYNFKGLKPIEAVKVGKMYKYYYGKTSDFNKIKKMRLEAVSKGYTGSFIVAVKNGKRVSVSRVLKGLE